MRYQVLAIALSSIASTSAWAGCVSEEMTFVSCTVKGGKMLSVCLEGDMAVYRFGPEGAPEITLSEPLATIDYRPWPGIGSTIWEVVRFTNGDITYAVNGSILRIAADEADGPNLGGGVEVWRGENLLATLECLPSSVAFPWSQTIGDAKRAAGLEWFPEDQSWKRTSD
ncbi:hypothetical protein [Rhodalgimonas zhirmunskyi]|uniref:Uncharacterized protein n=1 Tax=Rhodalgimonas zhirmunskyi TaxID=2964767 RepID=A0AAJ1UC91_9RHOB|nr:hypothetical protein [Rhodoalgimonas zhirmunskyi]MDQ2093252.1 hypothetical protein [Rhodoalgimonas zhirmunskyi]